MSAFKKVVVVGVGLIGGSLARDFLAKKMAKEVVGFDTDSKNLREALHLKIVTRRGRALRPELKDADLVVLAMPVGEIICWIQKNAGHVSEKTLVMDVGSTKKTILVAADRHFPNGNFVGSHPMAGNENSGAKKSSPDFFKNTACVVVPGKKSRNFFVNKAVWMWKKLGTQVYEMSAQKHDQYVAACSHMPHVLSFVLMNSLSGRFSLKLIRNIMGNSFRGMTRISGSDARMWTDIFRHNQSAVTGMIENFQKELDFFCKNLRGRNAGLLRSRIQKANRAHKKVWS